MGAWALDDAGRDIFVPVGIRAKAEKKLAEAEAEVERWSHFLALYDEFAEQSAEPNPHDGPVCVSCQQPRSQGSASMCRPCWLAKAKARWGVAS